MPISIVIADDHRLVLEALARTLSADAGFDVVGTTHAGREVLGLVGRTRPDVALLDVHMPDLGGVECLDQLRDSHPDVKVVFISAGADAAEIQRILARGAAGYLVKSINPDDIAATLRQIHDGTTYLAATPGPVAEDRGEVFAQQHGLTPKELQIVRAVARGLSNRAIAQDLWVTEQTVKFHLTNVYRKLDVTGRAAAVSLAVREGLAQPSPSAESGIGS